MSASTEVEKVNFQSKPNNKLRCYPHNLNWLLRKKSSENKNGVEHLPYTRQLCENEKTCRGSLRHPLGFKHHSFCGLKIRFSHLAQTVQIIQSFLGPPYSIKNLHPSPYLHRHPSGKLQLFLKLGTSGRCCPLASHSARNFSMMPFLIALSVGETLPIRKAATSQIQKQNKVTLHGFTDWISKHQARAIGRFTFQNFSENSNLNWKCESLTPPRWIEWSWTEPQSSMANWVTFKTPRFRDLIDF